MVSYRDASIKRKLTFVILCACVLGLSMTCMAFEIYERASFRGSMVRGLAANADSLGLATAASLTFDDKKFAEQMLSTIRAERYVMAAVLYDKNGKIFAEYRRDGLGAEFKTPAWKEEGTEFDPESLTAYRNISLGGEKVGSIAIVSDLSELQSKMREYRTLSVLVLAASILITFVISSRLVRLITQPILRLAEISGKVSAQKNYALRALSNGRDEVGKLVEAFNEMLTGIQERDAALQGAKDQLEVRVQERTEELRNEVKERQEAEAAMRLAKEAAEKASHAKSEFLANMSHEIRTPLNGVMGMTDLALETTLTPEQREYLETVKTSSEALLVVINDILDFSKIEADRIVLESAEFDLRDCLESALRTVAVRADEKGLELLCEVAPEVPEVVRGDAGRLRQVVLNLVGNAIKFTDAGEVAVRVEADAKTVADGVLHFTVSDTGIGVPEDKRETIFAPFTQADNSTTRKYGGTGLGLTISNRLVAMMGGAMWVESEIGKASHFHFTAHLAAASGKEITVGTPAPAEVLRGVKVLVVDDNRTNRRILQGMLTRWEMKALGVESGELALGQLSEAREAGEPYRLIVTDMHMPKMDGFELVEQIRRRPEMSTATIMMLTSAGHQGDAARCKELGVAAYLLKPIRQSELREAIGRVLGADNPEGAIPLITRYSLQDAREPGSSLKVLLAEDNVVNQRLVVRLLEKGGHRVAVAANGLEALAALKKEHFDLVLMDVQMPEMDGMEATAAIREEEKSSGEHQMVIALTAHAMKGDREKCLNAGMDGYLTKPIRPQELDEILEECLKEPACETGCGGRCRGKRMKNIGR
jgi:signal transduction histidine kinase/DNA-binding response OmpR family regulator